MGELNAAAAAEHTLWNDMTHAPFQCRTERSEASLPTLGGSTFPLPYRLGIPSFARNDMTRASLQRHIERNGRDLNAIRSNRTHA